MACSSDNCGTQKTMNTQLNCTHNIAKHNIHLGQFDRTINFRQQLILNFSPSTKYEVVIPGNQFKIISLVNETRQ